MPYIAPLAAAALVLLACTPKQVTHGTSAKQAAAADFGCEVSEMRIREEAAGVFLMDGCGQVASFYCTEGGSLDLSCRRIWDPAEVEGETLVDALTGHDKRRAEERRRGATGSASAASVAKTTPAAPPAGSNP